MIFVLSLFLRPSHSYLDGAAMSSSTTDEGESRLVKSKRTASNRKTSAKKTTTQNKSKTGQAEEANVQNTRFRSRAISIRKESARNTATVKSVSQRGSGGKCMFVSSQEL